MKEPTIIDKLNQQVARGQASDDALMRMTGQTVAEFDADTPAPDPRLSLRRMRIRDTKSTVMRMVTRGVTPDDYLVQLYPRPGFADLAGRWTQNGISVPSSGRWVVLPGGLIDSEHAAEIMRLASVLPTLYFGTRRDSPIIQVRADCDVSETRDTLLGGYGLRRAQREGR